ncbi:MAG: ATP-binding protein, partial [Chloroflexota bacterium]
PARAFNDASRPRWTRLLSGFRPSVILLFVTAIGTTFVAYAHEAGLVQTVSTDAISHWFDYSYWLMALIIMLAVIYLSTQRNEDARNALQAKNRILADQKIALEAQQLKLKEYQYHLEDLVAQRTDELLGAKEQAEEASRAKSDFLAKMSHELRTPLNAIIGYGEMVEEELVDAEFDPDVIQDNFRIQVSGKHLLTIIDNILDLTKIEKGQLVPHLDKVEVWPLVEEIILFARPLVVKGGNEIRVVEPTEGDTSRLLAVNADRQMVKQVLLNLISNAAKFTQNGLIELKIAFDERQVFFELTDSGVGIDTEFLPYIFEPFQQGENSMNRKYEGTGLGLTIAHEMVRQMGGDIRAANVKNGGAKFEFELNRHVSSRVTAPQR